MFLKLLTGNRMMKFTTKHYESKFSQYRSRNSMLFQTKILNKTLTLDVLRMICETAAMAEFDVKASYDWMIPVLVILACWRLGLGETVSNTILYMLENTKHPIRTEYSYSMDDYKTDIFGHIFGTGQGSRGSPIFRLTICDVIPIVLDEQVEGLKHKIHKTMCIVYRMKMCL